MKWHILIFFEEAGDGRVQQQFATGAPLIMVPPANVNGQANSPRSTTVSTANVSSAIQTTTTYQTNHYCVAASPMQQIAPVQQQALTPVFYFYSCLI